MISSLKVPREGLARTNKRYNESVADSACNEDPQTHTNTSFRVLLDETHASPIIK